MEGTQGWETTDVVICGCGPTGAVLSGLLGQLSVQNVVLERDAGVTSDPRGITLGDDGLRVAQRLGLYEQLYREIGQCTGNLLFLSGRAHDLYAKPFLQLKSTTPDHATGHPGIIFQKQPLLEHYLRVAANKTGVSEIRSCSTVTSIKEDDDWVYVTYQHRVSGKEAGLKCKFLVGSDGKTGFVRKNYLEPKGVLLERSSATPYEEVWVAINCKLTLPTPQTHPDFPLWKHGYSPQDVYNTFFPTNFRFVGNPDRPVVCGRFGLDNERLWRFEFVVHKNEDGQEMARREHLQQIMLPYLTHAGKRYGLNDDVQYPVNCIEILRSGPFTFSARSCNRWALNRVLLCGDAAHVFPPFGGQGIVSGIRDANGLAWCLALACRQNFKNHNELFKSWYTERKQQLDRSIAITVANGNAVTESNPLKIFVRDWTLWIMQMIPSKRREIEQGGPTQGPIRYKYEAGMAFLPDLDGGFCFPQVCCLGLGNPRVVRLTDDVIYGNSPKALFRLVVVIDDLDDLESSRDALSDIDRLSSNELRSSDATFIVQQTSTANPKLTSTPPSVNSIYYLATLAEVVASPLFDHRPDPEYYDPYRLRKAAGGKRFVVLRHDYFVFGVCADKLELDRAAAGIARLVSGASLRGGDGAGFVTANL